LPYFTSVKINPNIRAIKMDTLTISQTLQKAGLEREPAEAIAIHNKKLASKRDLYFLGVVMLAGFGYVVSLLNTLIVST
jgi:hypothetical protein